MLYQYYQKLHNKTQKFLDFFVLRNKIMVYTQDDLTEQNTHTTQNNVEKGKNVIIDFFCSRCLYYTVGSCLIEKPKF